MVQGGPADPDLHQIRRGLRPLILALAGLLGCGPLPPAELPGELDCDPRELGSGELRARQLACNDEAPSSGEGRKGDVLLQNQVLSVVLRTPWESLSRPGYGGGTLVDAAYPGWRDRVLELFPLVADGFLQATDQDLGTDAESAWVTFSGPGVALPPLGEGSPDTVAVTWRLWPDAPVIGLEGADGLWLRPQAGASFLASGFVIDGFAILTDGTAVEEPSGAQWLDGVTQLVAAPVDEAGLWRWPDGPAASGTCTGDAVEVLLDDERVHLLGPEFETRVPDGAQLRCVAEGALPGDPQAPAPELALVPGESGGAWLRIGDDRGQDLPALVTWADGVAALPAGGGWVPLLPGTHTLTVDGGPAYQRWVGDVSGDTALLLPQAIDTQGRVLLELGRDAWPSWSSGNSPADDLALAASQGRSLVIQTPRDEIGVPETDSWPARQIRGVGGSMAVTPDQGTVWSWPWTPLEKRAGHGAVVWQDRPAQDLLALAAGGQASRFTAVDVAWVDAAGSPWTWDPRPDLLRLASVDELPVLLDLLAQGTAIGVVGPLAWATADTDGGLPSAAALQRDLVTGRASATTGPLVTLTQVRERLTPYGRATTLALSVQTRDAAEVTALELYVDGARVASLALGPGATHRTLRWTGTLERSAVGVVQGPDWAVSAPILRTP